MLSLYKSDCKVTNFLAITQIIRKKNDYMMHKLYVFVHIFYSKFE